MLFYFHLLCYCSDLARAFSAADNDALIDTNVLEASSSSEDPNSEIWQSTTDYGPPITYPPLRKFINGNISSGSTRRIVGGRPTSIHHFPYTVAILRSGDLWCGGSLVQTMWVLTAAHCMKDVHGFNYKNRLGNFKVRAGSSHPRRGGILTDIIRAFFPKQYRPFLANFDYSLLQLRKELPLGETIALVRLPVQGSEVEEGKHIVVTGWGSTAPSGHGHLPDRLRYVTIPILARSTCQQYYYFPITANMICASYPEGGKDACNHDSGGPAIYNDRLVGIVSFGGRLCGDPKAPGVYSRVSKATKWIRDVIYLKSKRDLLRLSAPQVSKSEKKGNFRKRVNDGESEEPVFTEINNKIINGPLKKKYQNKYNTGVYVKKIGEDRRLMKYEPSFQVKKMGEENQKWNEFSSFTEIPVRKRYGRRSHFFNANDFNNVSGDVFDNIVTQSTYAPIWTIEKVLKLSNTSVDQDKVNDADNSVIISNQIKRSIYRPGILTSDNLPAAVFTGNQNELDFSIWKG